MANPTITGTRAGQPSTDESPVAPFSTVTISDPNARATDTLTIAVSGAGGTLTGTGLTPSGTNTYTLTGTAAQVTARLQALTFTPAAGKPGSQTTTRFTLTDRSSAAANARATDDATTVVDSDTPPAPAAPRLTAATDTGVSQTDNVTDIAAPAVTGNARPGAAVTVYDGGAVVGRGTADGTTGVYSIAVSGLAQGANAVTATQTAHGLTSAVGASRTVTLDTVAPRVTSIKPSGAGISATGAGDLGVGRTVTFSLATSEPVTVKGGVPTLTLNDGGTATYKGGSGSGVLTFTTTVAAGQNTAALAVTGIVTNGAILIDKAGNPLDPASLDTATRAAGPLVVDTTAPVVNLASAGGVTAAPSVTLAGTVAGFDAGTKVAVYDNGGKTAVATIKVKADGSFTIPTRLVAGANALSVVATDAAGNASRPVSVSYIDSPAAVRIDQAVSYNAGSFTIGGSVSAASGVTGVEIFARVGGQRRDLGAATVNSDGSFSFADAVGASTQSRIQAVATTGLGQTVTASAHFDLTGSIAGEPYTAEQDRYNLTTDAFAGQTFFAADGSVVYESTYTPGSDGTALYSYAGGAFFDGKGYSSFSDRTAADGNVLVDTKDLNGGHHLVTIEAPGQTVTSSAFDIYDNGGAPGSTFVFAQNHGLDTVNLFRVGGADHDTLSFTGADFGNAVAVVLENATDRKGGVVIADPVTGDTVKLTGITKAQLAANPGDIAFHA